MTSDEKQEENQKETPREEKARVDAEQHLRDSRQAWRDMKGGY
jgi:hypothetical protein